MVLGGTQTIKNEVERMGSTFPASPISGDILDRNQARSAAQVVVGCMYTAQSVVFSWSASLWVGMAAMTLKSMVTYRVLRHAHPLAGFQVSH
jgi:hypothetical protein